MSLQFSPKDLEAVRLIAENGSLTRTAELMHVSQPAISQRLAGIQERLGTDLFVRRDGRMQPTRAAERLAAAARSIDRVLDHALDDVQAMITERRRQLRITTQCHTCYRWLSFVIRDMLADYPDLVIDVIPEAVEDPYGAVARDEVDIAIVYLPEPASTLPHVELFDDELYAVMRKEHPLAHRSFLNPENFGTETLILYTGNRHAFVEDVLRPAGVTPARLRQVRMTEAIVELARAGQGIAVLAGWVLNDLVSRHDLVAIRVTRGGYRRRWQALVSPRCPEDVANAFVEKVRETAAAMNEDHWRQRLEVA